jgi:pyrroloquinoline quinone (PQQ) biosynthesis protein C
MSTAMEQFQRDVEFMWREATSLWTTRLVVEGKLAPAQLAMLTLQMYHYVKYTVPVFQWALTRVPAGEVHEPLRRMLAFFASDEDGHDRLALRDLAALGYDPEACARTLPLPTTLNLHGANRLAVEEYGPYYLVGETYATETVGARLSAAIHQAMVGRPELSSGITFYDVHGEADVIHAARSEELLIYALRDPANRRPLLLGCLTAWRNLAQLAAEIPRAPLYPDEFQLPAPTPS